MLAGALLLAQPQAAWAQAAAPSKADLASAKKHYGDGDKKYKAGDFAGAEVEFKAANDIKPAPAVERYMGLCEDALGHFSAAVDWYDRFLTHVPDKMSAQGDEVRARETQIKALPGKVHVDSTPPGAAISVDDKPQQAPTPADLDLAPGQHLIKLTAPGRLLTQKLVDVAFASKQTVSAVLDPQPPAPLGVAAVPVGAPTDPSLQPPPAAPPPPPEPRSKVPAYVTGGLAIVAAGVGTVFGIMTLSDKSDYDKNPSTATADNGDTHALICDMSFGVALTFGVTSAVLFLTKDEPPPAAAAAARPVTVEAKAEADAKRNRVRVTPTPIVSGSSGGAGVLVRF